MQPRELLGHMTLREKIGQMTQVEKGSITPDGVAAHAIGSVLSGGGGNPSPNDPAQWRAMVESFRAGARASRLGIPLLYGSDAVHGHNNLWGATIFPHAIGLGAAGDPALVRAIARATAREAAATGVRWSFAPALSMPLDLRWGRSYEGFGQDPTLIARLGAAVIDGYRGDGWATGDSLLPSAKHYLADGAAAYGSSQRIDRRDLEAALRDPTLTVAGPPEAIRALLAKGAWTLDQGDAQLPDDLLRRLFLAPYRAALAAGALTVMASFSSVRGVKLHGHHHWLTEVLKGELGFRGFVVSDWQGVDQLDADFATSVSGAINAGIDMVMVPYDYQRFIDTLETAVETGVVSVARIDDAVTRILGAKTTLGLFADPPAPEPGLEVIGCDAHRALAGEAVRRSAVLLQNRHAALPLAGTAGSILLAGVAADDIGLQCGGWTLSWMGSPGNITPGSTLHNGLRSHLGDAQMRFEPDGSGSERFAVGVVVLAEPPYAEGMGDRHDLDLSPADQALVARVRARVERLVVVLYSGRPLVLGPVAEVADALVAAWLPGSEGAALADLLLGRVPFAAQLRYRWPRASADLPLHPFTELADGAAARPALFEIGHGLPTSARSFP
jgi:beta-glucosidase